MRLHARWTLTRLRFRLWLRRSWPWILGAVGALLTLGYWRRQTSPTARAFDRARDDRTLADAVRGGLEKHATIEHAKAVQHLEAAKAHEAEAARKAAEVPKLADREVLDRFGAYAARARKRKLGKAGPLLALLAALTVPAYARAADPVDCLGAATDEPCFVLHPTVHTRGLWLSEPTYLEVLSDLAQLDDLRLALSHRQAATDALMREAETLRTATRVRSLALERLSTDLAGSLEREQAARARLHAWWRSPGLWFGVGLGLGVAASVTLAVSL